MESLKQISQIIRPKEPHQAMHSGSSTPSDNESTVMQQFKALSLGNLDTLKDVFVTGLKGKPVDDKDYLMERVIQIVSELPVTSSTSEKLTHSFLGLLWKDLQHPPISYLGDDYIYRKADGSNNNIRWPHIGQAGAPYARTVKPETVTPIDRPDPGVIFDSLLKRDKFKEHPNKISSVLFYLASIIIHDIFNTSHADFSKSQTSSYLDLAPLYGSSQDEQDEMRTFQDGKLKADCFSDKRILGFPPGVGLLLIMFNRWHNWIVGQLALIDEAGRFSSIRDKGPPAEAAARYDNALFQTGRLITGGLYINIILKDYVRTILNLNRTNSDWDLDPRSEAGKSMFGDDTAQATGNQVSAEFNLVYRWHSCVSERDEKWSQETYAKISGGTTPKSLNDFLQQIGKWALALPADPQARPFADLRRTPDGSFEDEDLAAIFTAGVEDVAGAFGARHVPEILKDIDVLGIIQSRAWNLASLNEFRKYFNLEPHKTFEDINPDPEVADALRHLYEHPDFVEIYPGIIVESAKEAMIPGSGLCTNFTISRAILSDAVGLVRGDRFYTVDYTSKNLTNFGFEAANYDLTVDNGCVFHKLVLRALPHNYSSDSIYAHFPMVVPSENEKIMTNLGHTDLYDFSKPTRVPKDAVVMSYAACRTILENWTTFAMPNLARDFAHLESSPDTKKLVANSIYVENWRPQVTKFYENITLELLQRNSYTLGSSTYVDIVRDVIIPVQVHFASSAFSLPLKSEHNPGGTYSEEELFSNMAHISHYLCYHTDSASSFDLRQALGKDVYRVAELLEMSVRSVDSKGKSGFAANLAERLYKHDELTDYGLQVIQRLLKSGLDVEALVWQQVLPTAAAMITQQSQSISQCLDFYLSEAGQSYLPEISRLAALDTADTDEKLERYFLEGSRIAYTSTFCRDATAETTLKDKDKSVKVKLGQGVLCDMQSAFRDPEVFPQPLKVDLNRDKELYTQYGFGPNGCLDEMSRVALTTMFKLIGRLKNLRRAPGPQGQMKTVEGPSGGLLYMNGDQTSFSPFPSTMKIRWD
jgi:linoleate 8R-lipoxygenase / 9,12-octadecadienoate 8-hydroperoxide 8R-isomerase